MDAKKRLRRARDAYDGGRLDDVVALLDGRDDLGGEARAVLALACLGRGDLPGAHRALEGAGEDHPDVLHAAAEVLLAEWRVDEARAHFERLVELEPDADTCERLALCADVAGDWDAADRWMARGRELDPERPPPHRVSERQFHELVREVTDYVPAWLAERIARANVHVVPMPSVEDVDPTDPLATPPDMLGLFTGASDLEAADEGGDFQPPPVIQLFQRNLERACADDDDLAVEIGVTLLHELGHELGFDEDGVDALGLA